MEFNCPLSSEKADRLARLLQPAADGVVLDAGCGEGAFLVRVVQSSVARGLGLDIRADCIAAAQRNAAGRVDAARCEFRVADVRRELLPDGGFAAAICLGATHAFGDGPDAYPRTLEALARAVRPGGRILLGDGYWKQPPAPEYLALIGEPVGIYRDHAANVAMAEERGLVPLYAAVGSEEEWDHFEWSHRLRIEEECLARLDDPEWRQKLRRSRAWRDGYLRWGRTTMGFGFYLFRRP